MLDNRSMRTVVPSQAHQCAIAVNNDESYYQKEDNHFYECKVHRNSSFEEKHIVSFNGHSWMGGIAKWNVHGGGLVLTARTDWHFFIVGQVCITVPILAGLLMDHRFLVVCREHVHSIEFFLIELVLVESGHMQTVEDWRNIVVELCTVSLIVVFSQKLQDIWRPEFDICYVFIKWLSFKYRYQHSIRCQTSKNFSIDNDYWHPINTWTMKCMVVSKIILIVNDGHSIETLISFYPFLFIGL